ESRRVDKVDRPLADDLIGNVHVIDRLRVSNVGNHVASFLILRGERTTTERSVQQKGRPVCRECVVRSTTSDGPNRTAFKPFGGPPKLAGIKAPAIGTPLSSCVPASSG